MLLIWLIPFSISIVVAVLIFVFGRYQDYYYTTYEVTKKELVVGLAIVSLLSPLIAWQGKRMAIDNAVEGFHEFWNGSMVAAQSNIIPCERDGKCKHTYECDPYEVLETYYTTEYYTDSNGESQSREVSHTRWVTEYHDCPYATLEFSYWLVDSFDREHKIWSNTFADVPVEWRSGSGIPSHVSTGEPPVWKQYKQLIQSGKAPGVTMENEYTNYVLASTDSILKPFSSDVERYKKMDLLPPHTENWDSPMITPWTANKVVFVGKTPTNANRWQTALTNFNAALGTELQGDMHVVVVPSSLIDNPQSYLNAIKAYWQGKEFGKRALSKNGIIVIIATKQNGSKVDWIKSSTGMPTGNGMMTTALDMIHGVAADPTTLFGDIRTSINVTLPIY
ncbi:hypothetical protein KC867_02525 [Candidatus Saccharibacteria bacterium]|nr:hypothetical protein [Candidatus Saccharibacteria bacterium]